MDRGGRGPTPRTDLSNDQRRNETRIVEPVGKRMSGRDRVCPITSCGTRQDLAAAHGSSIGQSGRASIGRQPRLRSRTTASRVNG